jgi:hypothetical protein
VFFNCQGKQKVKQKVKQLAIGNFFGSKPKGTSTANQWEPSELPVSSETLTPTDVSYNIGKESYNEGCTPIML